MGHKSTKVKNKESSGDEVSVGCWCWCRRKDPKDWQEVCYSPLSCAAEKAGDGCGLQKVGPPHHHGLTRQQQNTVEEELPAVVEGQDDMEEDFEEDLFFLPPEETTGYLYHYLDELDKVRAWSLPEVEVPETWFITYEEFLKDQESQACPGHAKDTQHNYGCYLQDITRRIDSFVYGKRNDAQHQPSCQDSVSSDGYFSAEEDFDSDDEYSSMNDFASINSLDSLDTTEDMSDTWNTGSEDLAGGDHSSAYSSSSSGWEEAARRVRRRTLAGVCLEVGQHYAFLVTVGLLVRHLCHGDIW